MGSIPVETVAVGVGKDSLVWGILPVAATAAAVVVDDDDDGVSGGGVNIE